MFKQVMNDLIISVAKERILPLESNMLDYPNEQFESQMYKLALYITKSILDIYSIICNWSFPITEESKLSLSLKTVFPKEWLRIADQSPHFHLQLQKIIEQYKLNLREESVNRIHRVVEFLCYEIIETATIYSNFRRISELTPNDIRNAIDGDSILHQIINQNNIYITQGIQLNHSMLEITGVEVSNKALRLLRIYVEELVKGTLDNRQNFDVLTLDDLERYFKRIPLIDKTNR